MSRHHGYALVTIVSAAVLDALLGLAYSWVTPGLPPWHGLFCALANAVTVGGDVTPRNTAGYVVTALECVTVVPLFAASFSLFTSGLAAVHVRAAETEIKAHVDRQGCGCPPPGV